jgi:hypothetical protein
MRVADQLVLERSARRALSQIMRSQFGGLRRRPGGRSEPLEEHDLHRKGYRRIGQLDNPAQGLLG